MTTNWSYSSGRFYTDENDVYIDSDFQVLFNPGKRNNKKLSPTHHLDFCVSKKFKINRFEVNAGLSVYNVFNKKNISHKRYNPYSSGKIISNVIMLGMTPTFFIEINFNICGGGENRTPVRNSLVINVYMLSLRIIILLFFKSETQIKKSQLI